MKPTSVHSVMWQNPMGCRKQPKYTFTLWRAVICYKNICFISAKLSTFWHSASVVTVKNECFLGSISQVTWKILVLPIARVSAGWIGILLEIVPLRRPPLYIYKAIFTCLCEKDRHVFYYLLNCNILGISQM